MTKIRVYLAAPGFNEEQMTKINNVETALEAEGYEVYSPFRDGIRLAPDSGREDREKVWVENTRGMDSSDLSIAILDDKDTGTLVEFGWQAKADHPIIAYAPRVGRLNVMLAEAVLAFCESPDKLLEVLRKIREPLESRKAIAMNLLSYSSLLKDPFFASLRDDYRYTGVIQ